MTRASIDVPASLLMIAGLAMMSPARSADRAPATARPVPLPPGVAAIVERAATCQHFAGEFSGDGSARDAEVNDALRESSCETIDSEVAAVRRKYPSNRAVNDALDAALAP